MDGLPNDDECPSAVTVRGTGAVEAVVKAVRILECLAGTGAGLGARDLAHRLGEPRSTVQRLLQTLQSCQMLVQDTTTLSYRLGPRTLQIGMASLHSVDLRREGIQIMRALRDATGETVGLNIRVGDARMYIEQVESPSQLRAKAEIGAPYPLHTGSPGRVLLAFLPQAEIDRVLDATLDALRWSDRAPRSRTEILEHLAEIRTCGYSMAFEETIAGLNTIAVPIRDHRGDVGGALSISGPAARFDAGRMTTVLEALLDAATEISGRIGHIVPAATRQAQRRKKASNAHGFHGEIRS